MMIITLPEDIISKVSNKNEYCLLSIIRVVHMEVIRVSITATLKNEAKSMKRAPIDHQGS